MTHRPALAISLYVLGKPCLVVGDDGLATERVGRLGQAGAHVTQRAAATVAESDVLHAWAIFVMDPLAADSVERWAHVHGRMLYIHDQPDRSAFAMPALARRGPLSVAISTDGRAPALARRFRQEFERLLAAAGPEIDALISALGDARDSLHGDARVQAVARLAARLQFVGALRVSPTDESPPLS